MADIDVAAVARRRAVAADREDAGDIVAVFALERRREDEVHAGVAAAAADRLRGKAGRPVAEGGDDPRSRGFAVVAVAANHGHVAGIAADAAGAADADRDRAALGRDRGR